MAIIVNRIGQTFNNLEIVEELGNNEVKTRCTVCGAVDIYNKGNLVSGITKICRSCKRDKKLLHIGDQKNGLTIVAIKRKDRIRQANNTVVRGNIQQKEADTEEANYVVVAKCDKCERINMIDYIDFKNKTVACRFCADTLSSTIVNREGEIYGKLRITKELGGGEVNAICMECHTENKYNKGNLVTGKVRCIICDKKGSGYFVNKRGKILNGLVVEKETKMADGSLAVLLRCLKCDSVYTAFKGPFLLGKVICSKCNADDLELICNGCGSKVTVKRYWAGKEIKCRTCGNDIDIAKAIKAEDLTLYCDTLLAKYKPDIKNAKYFVMGSLIMFAPAKYIGRNGQLYYDAYCLKCNKKIFLSKQEAKQYNHKICKANINMD